MNIDLNPNDALFNYIDSLLFDKDNNKSNSSEKSIEDTQLISNVDALKNISQSEKNDLDILLFHSAGIPLAISATEISDIIEIELPFLKTLDTNNEIPLRIFDYRGTKILILNTRDIILPDDHPARNVNLDNSKAYILLFEGKAYGLLCDDVGERIAIDKQNIEWRTQRNTRPWLVGIVNKYDYALLDEASIFNIAHSQNIITN